LIAAFAQGVVTKTTPQMSTTTTTTTDGLPLPDETPPEASHAAPPAAAFGAASATATQHTENVTADGIPPPPADGLGEHASNEQAANAVPHQDDLAALHAMLIDSVRAEVQEEVAHQLHSSGMVSFNDQQHRNPSPPASVHASYVPSASLHQPRGVPVHDDTTAPRHQAGLESKSVFQFRAYDAQHDCTPPIFKNNERAHTAVPRAVAKNLTSIVKRGKKDIRYDETWASPDSHFDRTPRGGDLKFLRLLRDCEKLLYGLATARHYPDSRLEIIDAMHDWLFFSIHVNTLELAALQSTQYSEASSAVTRAFHSTANRTVIPESVAQLVATADGNAREERLIKLLSAITNRSGGSASGSSNGRGSGNNYARGSGISYSRGNTGSARGGRGSAGGGRTGGFQRRPQQYRYNNDSERRPEHGGARSGGAGRGGTTVTGRAGDQGQ